ncbi:AroM family protein [Enterobacteriaceae bacterium H20N1]|uniref:AroM family protein n=1 Tax=Dryocola boscaweniae TaxID=2925397 RepID=A0A9X3AMC6_9ENTR|nr:AroM family protein [Dryocola boscaweniae]MCT4701092.1 AroM family protein [Dryocola boscaweniae]MCT4714520.1 AroM family protein [Dryocola boscaweniae]MCT4718136.1 AroM family protein [Dryocola boscaweniae]
MKPALAILTIGVVPVSEILPLLTEHISEDRIKHVMLLGNMSREEVIAEFGPEQGEEEILTLLADKTLAHVGKRKVEQALQGVIKLLDRQEYDVILLMSTERFNGLVAHNGILLEPERIIPPLVASIVDGHQVGIILPVPELLKSQHKKWQQLEKTPLYELANPVHGTDEDLLNAGKKLLAEGADVLVLDCLGFHQKHRDMLQKALDVPVLLSNVLIARLASELLA